MAKKGTLIAKVGQAKKTGDIIQSISNEPLKRKHISGQAAIIDNEKDLSKLAKEMPDLFVYDSVAKELRCK